MTASTTDQQHEPLGFEKQLWAAADKLRGNLDAAEYKHVVLGLVFLKYVSDSFSRHREFLASEVEREDSEYYMPDEEAREELLEDRDEYLAANVFWVPVEARWERIQAQAKQRDVGGVIDRAMDELERANPSLRGVLPKNYATPALDKRRLGELVDLVSGIGFADGDGDKDPIGRVYEYFLGNFAEQEGKGGGEFYTPRPVVQVLVEMLEPYTGRVYDPCCGSGGMFVQSAKFVEAHGGNVDRLSVYGQELNATTWKMARMNLAIRGIEADLGEQWADTFHDDQHPDLRADYILANPPFNISDWGGELLQDDARWQYGTPPKNNANFAWLQHIAYHLAPGGTAGVVLANGSLSSQQSGEGEIRQRLVEADLVDCIIALPSQLFYTTQIPACLWFLARGRGNGRFRDRRGEVLFIDARKLGQMATRTQRVLTTEDITRVAQTYHAWRGEPDAGDYEDVAGFCKAATLSEIAEHHHVLTPGRYVGAEAAEEDDEPFQDKMTRLTSELAEQFAESAELENRIRRNLEELGYGV